MKEFQGQGALYYDMYDQGLWGDVEFYTKETGLSGGPVLELGCGTGRMLLPLAQAGCDVTGLDCSQDMLTIARDKMAELPLETQQRMSLVEGRMQHFALGRAFQTILIPHRAFMHLMDVGEQMAALRCIREHLLPTGKLILNIVTPPIEEIASHIGFAGGALQLSDTFTNPKTGNQVISWTSRRYDPGSQRVEQYYVFEELDAFGNVLNRAYTPLYARYTHRFEMQHLLNLCGFSTLALYGDFQKGPYREGGEQIWIVTPSSS